MVDLGLFASDAGVRETWQKVSQDQARFDQAVHSLEPDSGGRRLLAGPFWGEEAARDACASARQQGLKCDPRQASAVRSGAAGQAAPSPGQ